MSDSEPASSQPRRSQREKRQSKPFTSSQLKRKRSDDTDDEQLSDASSGKDAQHSDGGDDDDDERGGAYAAPKKKAAAKRARAKAPATPRAKVTKTPAAAKPAGTSARAKRKPREGAQAFDAEAVGKETKLHTDNTIFNAIMNPATALKLTAEEFLDALSAEENDALADLVNCMFRACGCNASVDADVATDEDGVVDRLDEITEVLKQDDSPVYPLTSKLPIFKKFRKSLAEFLHRLIAAAAETGQLYSSALIDVCKHWVAAMSSSQLRSFRHTATVLALEIAIALCDVAAAVEKEASTTGRQLEAEKKRKTKGVSRVKELEQQVADIGERKETLNDTLQALTDGVFVNRYRDLDPAIRAECIHALGQWFKKYPSHFLDGSYLRYVGWVLSDKNNPVRLESVRALAHIYDNADYVASLQAFTERSKARLLQMAAADADLSVRVATVNVLAAIDAHALLADDEREELCLLVYDAEPRVRRAVAPFVRGVWADAVKTRLAGRRAGEEGEARAGAKALGSLLVRLGRALERAAGADEDDTGDELGGGDGAPRRAQLLAAAHGAAKGRTAVAVEALWDAVPPVANWEALLELLLLDHSAEGEAPQGRARKGKGRTASKDGAVDEAWRLEEVEEATLLEVLVASLGKAAADAAASTKKAEGENVAGEITRALINALPALFAKHQADEKRIAQVLLIPPLMNLDLYLEMRMVPAYEALWDDVIKQFTSHSSPTIIAHAVSAVLHLEQATSLSAPNGAKTEELRDALAGALRDVVGGREELAIATLTEEEARTLGAACARIAALAQRSNLAAWLEEDAEGNASAVYDIASVLAERGRLGYRHEEQMVQECLALLSVHTMWKMVGLPEEPEDDAPEHEAYIEQRRLLIERLVEFAVGTQSNTAEEVKRTAFKSLMTLHILFAPSDTLEPRLALELDDEVQKRCADFLQGEIERFAAELDNEEDEEEDEESHQSGSEDGDTQLVKKRKRTKAAPPADGAASRSRRERQLLFVDFVNSFTRAIAVGAVDVRHGVGVLAHYGRLGEMYDAAGAKTVMEALRDRALYDGDGALAVDVVGAALREAFALHLGGLVADEARAAALAKLLLGALVVRGAHLAVVRALDAKFVVRIHTELLSWAIRRVGAAEANKNKQARNSALLFFRVLAVLLAPVDAHNALAIKAHMDQALAQAKLTASATAAAWQPQREYERKLNNIMTKGKGGAARGRKSKAAAHATTTDDEQDGASEAEIERDLAPAPKPKPRPRARPVRATRASAAAAAAAGPPSSPPSQAGDLPAPTTRKRKAPARSPNKTPTRARAAEDEDGDGDREVTPTPGASGSRKRAREDDDEEMEEGVSGGGGAPSSPLSAVGGAGSRPGSVAPPSPASSQASVRITRKRVRR